MTIATLSSFRKPAQARGGLSPAQDAALLEAWGEALAAAFAARPEPAFELEARAVELSPGAAFLHFDDPSGAVARLRALVAAVRDDDGLGDTTTGGAGGGGALAGLDAELGGRVRASVHIPDIVHSSYARFVDAAVEPKSATAGAAARPTTGGATAMPAAAAGGTALEERFAAMAAGFRPFRVKVRGLTLANECSPYMHQGRDEGTARFFPLSHGN